VNSSIRVAVAGCPQSPTTPFRRFFVKPEGLLHLAFKA